MDKTSSMYLYVKLNWDANRFLPAESKDCMNSASYEYRNMSARRGAQFVPMGMPIICWKTFPAKTTKMLSTRNSSILIMSSSVYFKIFDFHYPHIPFCNFQNSISEKNVLLLNFCLCVYEYIVHYTPQHCFNNSNARACTFAQPSPTF